MTSGWTARVLTCILLDGVNLLDTGLRDQGRVEQVEVHYRLPYRKKRIFLVCDWSVWLILSAYLLSVLIAHRLCFRMKIPLKKKEEKKKRKQGGNKRTVAKSRKKGTNQTPGAENEVCYRGVST